MIKLNRALFLASLVVASEIMEICFYDFLKSALLNSKPPTNYQEHSDANKEDGIKWDVILWNLDMDRQRSQLEKSIYKMDLLDSRAIELAESYINPLVAFISHLKSKFIPSLYPYFDPERLEYVFNHFEFTYIRFKKMADQIYNRDKKIENIRVYLKNEMDEILENIKQEESDLKKVFFFSLLTKSKDAEEHRQIHSEIKNRLNDVNIKKKCYFCNKIIKQNHYVVSLLCGHQLHVTCIEKNGLVDNCPICKESIWCKIQVEESALLN